MPKVSPSSAKVRDSVTEARAILDAAKRLAGERPWYEIPLSEIAAAAELPVGTLYRHYPSRLALLRDILKEIDDTVLADPTSPADSARDRLFELLMRRFDALTPYRTALGQAAKAVRPIISGVPTRLEAGPSGLLAALHVPCAMARTFEAAGIPIAGLRGMARTKVLSLVFLTGLRTWIDDDSADLGSTMAALDRALSRAEPWLGLPSASSPTPSSDDNDTLVSPA